MNRDWHELFKTWAKAPSDTEEKKSANAAKLVRQAVNGTGVLNGRSFDVYATGSYRNNTNIRLGSDIDLAVVLRGPFFYSLPDGMKPADFGLGKSSDYGWGAFRADVEKALKAGFGADARPSKKTIHVVANSNRLPADATAFLPHRAYSGKQKPDGTWHYDEGVEMRPAGLRVINWHQQHYDEGVRKNEATGKRFKRIARVLKNLRDDMGQSGSPQAKSAAAKVPSFLLECLAFNAPDACFHKVKGSNFEDVKAVVASNWHATKNDTAAAGLVEVSGKKLLFGAHQGWSRADAHAFVDRAWKHVGFE